jgi:DUF4097 and DUF4098 domain-containing protein YvlB
VAARLHTTLFRRLFLVLLCAGVSRLAPAVAGAADLTEHVPVAAGGTLNIALDRGSVAIHSHDATEIHIEARARGLGASSVRVEGVKGGVELATSGGAIVSEAVRGTVSAATSGGRIALAEVAGDVRAIAIEGRIHLTAVLGDVEARTIGGAIEIDGVSGSVHAKTHGGSIRTRFLRVPSGRVETSGGAIEVAFPASAGAHLDAAANGGRVHVEHGVGGPAIADSGRVVGAVNGGGPTLRLRATGGDIHVRRP